MELSKEEAARIVGIFRSEAEVLIRSLTEAFMSLDSSGDKDLKELLRRAFRDAHTLKGAASTLGFERVSVITHHLEDVLEKLNRRDQPIEAETVDLLLSSLDVLQKTLHTSQPEDAKPTEEEVHLAKQLDELAGNVSASETDKPDTSLPVQPSGTDPQRDQTTLSAFRKKSLEVIGSTATALHNLTNADEANSYRLLDQAIADLEGLNNLAKRLQHRAVTATALQLIDAIKAIRQKQIPLEKAITDLLLRGLSMVLKAAEKHFESEMQWTVQDEETAIRLRQLVDRSDKGDEETPKISSESQRTNAREVSGESARREGEAEQKDGVTAEGAVLRISESRIDDLIAQVDELFEVHLQVGSLLTPLDRINHSIREIEDRLRAVKNELEETKGIGRIDPIVSDVHGLAIQTETITKQFNYDKRQLAKLVSGIQQELRGIRLAPVSTIYTAIRRQVRELAKATDKQVALLLDSGRHAVDRRVLEAIEAPINHILRNAIDHGIEHTEERIEAGKSKKGHISVRTRHTGDAVELTIVDDGRGIDHEAIRNRLLREKRLTKDYVQSLKQEQLLDYLFEPGFTTKSRVTQISGRGVGMDIVRHTVESLGGEVRINSVSGGGTSITLRLPIAMSTIQCLLFRVARRIMAIPAYNVEKVIAIGPDASRRVAGDVVVVYKDENLPLRSIGGTLGLTRNDGKDPEYSRMAIIVVFGERRVAFQIDEIVEYAQLILKPLGDLLERVPNVYGISSLGTGELALVLNPGDLVRTSEGGRQSQTRRELQEASALSRSRRILVVDDSITTRTLEKSLLEAAGFEVVAVSDGYQALQALSAGRFNLVISDIQMPNMDGLELTRTIKSREDLTHLPVILISALGSDQDKKNGMAAGADAYIVKKDLTQADLVDTIDQLL